MNPWLYVGRHRADVETVTLLAHYRFAPKHCAGATCVHDHLGETPRPVIRTWLRRAA